MLEKCGGRNIQHSRQNLKPQVINKCFPTLDDIFSLMPVNINTFLNPTKTETHLFEPPDGGRLADGTVYFESRKQKVVDVTAHFSGTHLHLFVVSFRQNSR
jgi:hypothetical protein